MKGSLVVAAVAVIALIAAAAYLTQKSTPETASLTAVPSQAADSIPTPQYLFAHPDSLKEAEQKCREGGGPSSLYCSNVHRAESLRLADQYRRSLQPNGAAR
jgi:hypothetical protein